MKANIITIASFLLFYNCQSMVTNKKVGSTLIFDKKTNPVLWQESKNDIKSNTNSEVLYPEFKYRDL